MTYQEAKAVCALFMIGFFVVFVVATILGELKRKREYKRDRIRHLKNDCILMRNREHDEIIREKLSV